jgi:hypothetical protein
LVQSTLFPHKPPEPRDKPNERDDEVDEQDEDYRDAANHMKRKSKGKATPRKKGSNFQVDDILFIVFSLFINFSCNPITALGMCYGG